MEKDGCEDGFYDVFGERRLDDGVEHELWRPVHDGLDVIEEDRMMMRGKEREVEFESERMEGGRSGLC